MRVVDSHCHLDRFDAAERGEVVGRAAAAGVGEMLAISTRWSERDAILSIARAQSEAGPRIWCTVGIHPDHVEDEALPDAAALAGCVRANPQIVGIGESGLDHAVATSARSVQEASFRTHVRAARAAGVPLVIHARGADEDIARVLRSEHAEGGAFDFVLHCFASGRPLAELGIALGGYVSFSGILTFPKSGALRELARDLPADRLLVETDAPFLAPQPVRGRRCEPAHVVHTARVLAEQRGLSLEALAELTTANFHRLFRKAA